MNNIRKSVDTSETELHNIYIDCNSKEGKFLVQVVPKNKEKK